MPIIPRALEAPQEACPDAPDLLPVPVRAPRPTIARRSDSAEELVAALEVLAGRVCAGQVVMIDHQLRGARGYFATLATWCGGLIVLDERLDPLARLEVLAHELGHALDHYVGNDIGNVADGRVDHVAEAVADVIAYALVSEARRAVLAGEIDRPRMLTRRAS